VQRHCGRAVLASVRRTGQPTRRFLVPVWRQEGTAEIPVPRIPLLTRSRIFQWFEFQPVDGQANAPAIFQQPLAVGRYQVCHGPPLPSVAVQPQPTIHGVNHSIAAQSKFPVGSTGA
jgi:hypothetical protein